MKKFYIYMISLLILTSFNVAYTQSFGFQFGLNLSTISIKGNNGISLQEGITPRFGLQIGCIYKLPLNSFIELETGILYTNKGYTFQFDHFDYYGEKNYNINYLELPINLLVGYNLKNSRLYILTGAYIAYGVTGSILHTYYDFGGNLNKEYKKIQWGKNELNDFQRLDYGLNLGVGIGFKSYQINIIYKEGFNNLLEYHYPYPHYQPYPIYNRVYTISFSYYFPKENGNKTTN